MLEYRDYMRRPQARPMRSATEILIAINVVVFVGQCLLSEGARREFFHYGALSTGGLAHGYVWQLMSYQFMHGGVFHLAFNCLTIYFFGKELEAFIGVRRFLVLYFASGILGGLVQALAGLVFGGLFAAPTVGASAAAYGLIAAFACLFPDALMIVTFLPIRAKNFLWLSIAAAILGMLTMSPDDKIKIAHAAHFGGILAGVLYVKYVLGGAAPIGEGYASGVMHEPEDTYGLFRPREEKEEEEKEELPTGEYLEREVDPILDKISAQGIKSLTAREKKILEAARQKMGKR